MKNLTNSIIRIISEANQVFEDLKVQETNLPVETPRVEIDIGCRKAIQIVKIYTALLLAEKNSEPVGELGLLTDIKEINKVLQTVHPEIKTKIIKLVERDIGKQTDAEYIPVIFNNLR